MAGETERIEKQILLRAPRSRVWRALSDAFEQHLAKAGERWPATPR
jgi:uncharacterized protein YndB with AHSA1/START domain